MLSSNAAIVVTAAHQRLSAALVAKTVNREMEEAFGGSMPQISFAADIKPLFRAIDISHMKRLGVALDDYSYMSNPDHANRAYATLSPHDGEPPAMPPGGPYWTPDQLALFVQWQKDGYQP